MENQDEVFESDLTGDPGDVAPKPYGSDWVGIDGRAMRARRDTQRRRAKEAVAQERARRERAEAEILAMSDDDVPVSVNAASYDSAPTPRAPQQRARPTALIERLHIQNLRSFSGAHDVELAPLTLIYGPNSAGKSTVLKALKLLMQTVDAGRTDALRAWDKAFEEASARNLITYAEPDPEDPSGFQWQSPLVLGVDFRTRDGRLARAELSYDLNPVGSIDMHATALAVIGEGQFSRKRFIPEDFTDDRDPFHPSDFGNGLLTRFRVGESRGGSEWVEESRLVDAELFAHEDRKLQSDLFEMAFLLRYFGPHRGEPGQSYDPERGVYNSDWFEFFGKPRRSGFSEFDLLNQMLAQLEVPYVFEQDALARLRSPIQQTWIMKDVRSGAPVSLDQVGYGVSQLLPVVDVSVHAERQIICVEEPELHLHPRLQARLGNLFATAVIRGRNQVIIETHSESILLRLRRLIRNGKLRADDVAVLYVDNVDEAGATARRLRIGERGELLDPWPTGFFDDGLADILGITA